MKRDEFLKLMVAGGASFLGGAEQVLALDPKRGSLTPWGRLKFRARDGDEDNWNVHPHGDMNLIDHMMDNTSVNISKKWNVAEISKLDEMVQYPFLFMHAESPPELSALDRKNLREYLLRGGFLYAEDCVIGKNSMGFNKRNDHFFVRMAEELPLLLPEAKFEKLPKDHPVFHCYYHLPDGMPWIQGTDHGAYGLTLNGRLLCLLSPYDNHCGWTAGRRWFGRKKEELAMKMGTNLYIYAMTQGSGTAGA